MLIVLLIKKKNLLCSKSFDLNNNTSDLTSTGFISSNKNLETDKFNISSEKNEENDLISKNNRFYHVFKKNELNDLVRESCPNLLIYESYYDHGNWVICARKESE